MRQILRYRTTDRARAFLSRGAPSVVALVLFSGCMRATPAPGLAAALKEKNTPLPALVVESAALSTDLTLNAGDPETLASPDPVSLSFPLQDLDPSHDISWSVSSSNEALIPSSAVSLGAVQLVDGVPTLPLNVSARENRIGTTTLTVAWQDRFKRRTATLTYSLRPQHSASLTTEDTFTLDLTETATLLAGESPTFSIETHPESGAVTQNEESPHEFTYTPASDTSGEVRFSYRITTDLDTVEGVVVLSVSGPLRISPKALVLHPAHTSEVQFAASGGVGAKSSSLDSGPGSLNTTTGVYTVDATRGRAAIQVRATDSDSPPTEVTATAHQIATRFNGAINAIAIQGGYGYFGGSFSAYNPQLMNGLGKVNSTTGDLEAGCNFAGLLNAGALVRSIAETSTHVYVGGTFTSYAGTTVQNLIKVHKSSCELDTTFSQTTGPNAPVWTLAVSESALYVAGDFTSYRAASAHYLAKIDLATGALDTTFTQVTGPNSPVRALALSQSALYVGGTFTSYRSSPAPYLAKIDPANGNLDTTFTQATGVSGFVYALALSDSALYLGGSFTSYRSSDAPWLAKVDLANGDLDTAFTQSSGANGTIRALALSDSALYFGGDFTNYRAQDAPYLAKVSLETGTLDTTFTEDPGFSGPVNAVALSGDALYVGGEFTTYRGVAAQRIAKVALTNGSLDTTFTQNTGANSAVYVLAPSGNSLYIGGSLNAYRGTPAQGLAKVALATGDLDLTFTASSGFNSTVHALALTSSSLYVGGTFTHYRGSTALRLAKIDLSTGELDTSFTQATGLNNQVRTLAVAGGALYVGGDFTSYRSGTAQRLAKVDLSNGNLDTTFTQSTGANAAVRALTIAGSSLYFGGDFTSYRSGSAGRLAKVDLTTGALDGAFQWVGADGRVDALAVAGSSLYLGGSFSNYDGNSAQGLAKIHLVSGEFDSTFTQSSGVNAAVRALAVSGDSLYLGGQFTTYRGVAAQGLAKVTLTTGDLDTTFTESTGVSNWVYALTVSGNSLYTGGFFTTYRGTNPENSALYFTVVDLETGDFADDVISVNAAPSLSTIAAIAGAEQDTPFTLSYETLAAAADATDPDGTLPLFRMESVGSGTLTKNGVAVTTGEGGTVLEPTGELVWTPDPGASGTGVDALAAFTVVAFDGEYESSAPVTVMIEVAEANTPPTGISLSNPEVNENQGPNALVGTLAAVDSDVGDTHTYSIVTGFGDFGDFSIGGESGDELRLIPSADFETKHEYSVQVRTTDSGGAEAIETFAISIVDDYDAPTAISLSSSTLTENNSPNAVVGSLSSTDVDFLDSHAYSLVAGTGDTDNASFNLSGDSLRITSAADFETQPSYSVRIRSTDNGGLWFEQAFTITVTNANEAPTEVILSSSTIDDGSTGTTLVGTLSATDPDSGDTHSFALLAADYGDNPDFSIEGNTLNFIGTADHAVKSSYFIRVVATDNGTGTLSWAETLAITVNEPTDPPADDPRTVYLAASGCDDGAAVIGDSTPPFCTAQAAVNAAIAASPTSGSPVTLSVGSISAAEAGDVTLTAHFGQYVNWVGLGTDVSQIGNIVATGSIGAAGSYGSGGTWDGAECQGDPIVNGEDGGSGTLGYNLWLNSDGNITFGNIDASGGNGGRGGDGGGDEYCASSGGQGGNAGNGGSIILVNVTAGTVTSNGGDAGDGGVQTGGSSYPGSPGYPGGITATNSTINSTSLNGGGGLGSSSGGLLVLNHSTVTSNCSANGGGDGELDSSCGIGGTIHYNHSEEGSSSCENYMLSSNGSSACGSVSLPQGGEGFLCQNSATLTVSESSGNLTVSGGSSGYYGWSSNSAGASFSVSSPSAETTIQYYDDVPETSDTITVLDYFCENIPAATVETTPSP